MNTKRIVITPGEPAGIGPDLVLSLAEQDWPVQLVLMADPELLRARAAQRNISVEIQQYHPEAPTIPQPAGILTVSPVSLNTTAEPGTLNSQNGLYVLETLRRAAQGCLSGEFDALVTGPVHKGVINDAGVHFSGHTEFFAEQADVDKVVMMLATEGLRVALVTTHLPLREVADAVTPENLERTLCILQKDLQTQFGIAQPHILVCGLNPHAGEGGHMGREEIDVIEPVLHKLREEGYSLEGPLPADTLFQDKYLERADAVLAMYHDQGLPVLKYKGFGRAVNITLGLPFIRTSVDHGTALELAGSGKINNGSLLTALEQAISMVNHKQ